MPADQTTNLGLPYLLEAQAQKHVTVNESLARLDALVQAAVESRAVDVQPGAPGDGETWITPPGKTGADWGGYANWSLAHYRDGVWSPITPKTGWRVWVKDEGRLAAYDGATWRADASVDSLNAGPIAGFRNVVSNGDFRVAQRGAAFSWAGAPGSVRTLDRWDAYMSGAGDAVLRVAAPAGLSRDGVRHALEFQVPVAGAYQYLSHRIEGVETLAGGPCTLAFDVWADAPMSIAQISIFQNFGSGGSATAAAAHRFEVAVTTAPARLSITFDMPSVAGKTIGAGSHVWVLIYLNAGVAETSGSLRIADVQLERGAVATPFEMRPLALETALCKRYARVLGYGVQGEWESATTAVLACAFETPMRVAPTLALLTTTPSVDEVGGTTRVGSGSTLVGAQTSEDGVRVARIGGFSGATAQRGAVGVSNMLLADAEL